MIVVDASVAVKWFLPENGEEAAAKLLTGSRRLVAPSLIRLEVTGAFIRQFREGDLTEAKARLCVEGWESMLERRVVQLIPEPELFDDAVEMAFRARHTVTDCLYLAAAKRFDADVITADKPMRDRGPRVYKRITFLDGAETN